MAVNHGETGKFIENIKVGIACTEKKEDIANSILSLLMDDTYFMQIKIKLKYAKKKIYGPKGLRK